MFSGLQREELLKFAELTRERTYPKGSVILFQGDPGDSLYVLRQGRVKVVLIDANPVGHGVTGHTTAKVSSQHGLVYARLRSRFGADGARTYAQANEGALEWIADRVEQDGIDCDFRRRPAYAYATSPSERSKERSAPRTSPRRRPGRRRWTARCSSTWPAA